MLLVAMGDHPGQKGGGSHHHHCCPSHFNQSSLWDSAAAPRSPFAIEDDDEEEEDSNNTAFTETASSPNRGVERACVRTESMGRLLGLHTGSEFQGLSSSLDYHNRTGYTKEAHQSNPSIEENKSSKKINVQDLDPWSADVGKEESDVKISEDREDQVSDGVSCLTSVPQAVNIESIVFGVCTGDKKEVDKLDLSCDLPKNTMRESVTTVDSIGVDENMNIAAVTVSPLTCQSSERTSVFSTASAFSNMPELKDGDSALSFRFGPNRKWEPYHPNSENEINEQHYMYGRNTSGHTLPKDWTSGVSRRLPLDDFSPRTQIDESLWGRERSPFHPVVQTLPRSKDNPASRNTSYAFVPIMYTDLNQIIPTSGELTATSEQAGRIVHSHVRSLSEEVYNPNDVDSLENYHNEIKDWPDDEDDEEAHVVWNVDQEVAMVTSPEEEQEEDEILFLDLIQEEEEDGSTTFRPGNPVADTLDGDDH